MKTITDERLAELIGQMSKERPHGMKDQLERDVFSVFTELQELRAQFPKFADTGKTITPDSTCWAYDAEEDPPLDYFSGRTAIMCPHDWYSTREAAEEAQKGAAK